MTHGEAHVSHIRPTCAAASSSEGSAGPPSTPQIRLVFRSACTARQPVAAYGAPPPLSRSGGEHGTGGRARAAAVARPMRAMVVSSAGEMEAPSEALAPEEPASSSETTGVKTSPNRSADPPPSPPPCRRTPGASEARHARAARASSRTRVAVASTSVLCRKARHAWPGAVGAKQPALALYAQPRSVGCHGS